MTQENSEKVPPRYNKKKSERVLGVTQKISKSSWPDQIKSEGIQEKGRVPGLLRKGLRSYLD